MRLGASVEVPSVASTGLLKRASARLFSLEHRQRIAVILLVGVVVYGSFIVADGLILRPYFDSAFGPTPDLKIYQERTSLILNGGIIYRDLDIESPPLINYILLPAQMAGGDWWAYEIYFSIFPILTGLLLYLTVRRWDERDAFIAALVVVLCPFAVQDATWGIQDEPLVAFFYILPALLLLVSRKGLSAIAAIAGFWTKFLPIILYPLVLISVEGWRGRLKNLGIAVLTSLLIALPFLLVCPIEFLNFPSYYLLGRSGEGSAGMSVLNLLAVGGLAFPSWFGAGLTVMVLIISYYLFIRWKLDVWRAAMLTTVMFMSVYPMLRLGYYIFPFVFFSVWAVRHKEIVLRLIPMYLLLLFGQALEQIGSHGHSFPYYWLVAALLVLAGTVVMIDIARLCLKKKCFLDNEVERREGPSSV